MALDSSYDTLLKQKQINSTICRNKKNPYSLQKPKKNL
jgi:hypothetical protein